jgi:hypothetical protein
VADDSVLVCEFVRQSLVLVFDLANFLCLPSELLFLLGRLLLSVVECYNQLSIVFHELADSGPEFFLLLG